jgi:hypothetical protein
MEATTERERERERERGNGECLRRKKMGEGGGAHKEKIVKPRAHKRLVFSKL